MSFTINVHSFTCRVFHCSSTASNPANHTTAEPAYTESSYRLLATTPKYRAAKSIPSCKSPKLDLSPADYLSSCTSENVYLPDLGGKDITGFLSNMHHPPVDKQNLSGSEKNIRNILTSVEESSLFLPENMPQSNQGSLSELIVPRVVSITHVSPKESVSSSSHLDSGKIMSAIVPM